MSNIINNIDLEKIHNTAENGRKDRQSLRKPVKLEGEWNLFDIDKGYQFRTELSYELFLSNNFNWSKLMAGIEELPLAHRYYFSLMAVNYF